ncbi:MAG TPA: N,N-dimethylformamidase beta subunit family domain-containing protein [Gaiellales bacterium]|jgi:hypothetical protein|nr:N,N-dimethylformamidase beta subunit family domain-containing protein [Gaiellales bacterium]
MPLFLRRGAWCCAALALAAGGWCGSAPAAAPPPTAAENARAGTTGWYVPRPSQERIAGYAGAASYLPGRTARLFVDSHGRPFRYRIFRLGWYRGRTGRVAASGRVAVNPRQPLPRILDDRPQGAKLLVTGWRASVAFTVGATWPSGFYLVRLDLERGAGASYASFVVRAAHPGPIAVVLATNTWQAYNSWGGVSLYRDLRQRGAAAWTRADVGHMVTSLRPYVQGYGAGDVFRYDLPLIRWLERIGYPVSYVTDRDVAGGRATGSRTRLVILSGHPEYQDTGERNQLVQLVRRGVSLAVLGGNSLAWHARLEHGDQRMSVWRERRLDPHPGASATVHWISLGWDPATLTGVRPVHGPTGPLTLAAPWSWAWAGVPARSRLGDVLGAEYDGLAGRRAPRRTTVLASAPIAGGSASVTWTLVQHPGGAFVFSGSELGFSWQLDFRSLPSQRWIDAASPPGSQRDYPRSSRVRRAAQRLVENLIAHATGLAA